MKTKTFLKVWHSSIRIRQLVTLLCLIALLSAAGAALAQQQTKRPITHSDYDSWRTIQGPQISRDGKFVAYAFLPEDGDGETVERLVGRLGHDRVNDLTLLVLADPRRHLLT